MASRKSGPQPGVRQKAQLMSSSEIDHQLIRTGPYAHMRHPIYSGVLLAVLGTALVLGECRALLGFAVLLVNYSIKAKKEDRILAARFSSEFPDHEAHAGFLLPRLRPKKSF